MALVFGSGEQVDRLRRGLDIKGRVVLGVDETIVPTVLVGDFTAAPYRKTGIRWYAPLPIGAVAAQFGRYRVFHTNTVDQLIDRFYLAANAGMDVRIGAGEFGAVGGTAAVTTELVSLPLGGGGAITRPLGIFALADQNAAVTMVTDLFRVDVPAIGTLIVPCEIVLPAVRDPELPNFSTLTVEARSVNIAFTCCASGLYFDTLPLNVRT